MGNSSSASGWDSNHSGSESDRNEGNAEEEQIREDSSSSSLSDLRVYEQRDPCKVKYNQYEQTISGWPAKCSVSMVVKKDHLPIKRVIVSCQASDQGWGNTGHSKICLVVHDATEERKVKTISVLGHGNTTYEFCIDNETDTEFFADLKAGEIIGLWAVSAPYPGFAANVTHTSLEVLITNNWARRRQAVLFLYWSGFLQLRCEYEKETQSEAVIQRDTDLRHNHPAMFAVCGNNDLCREIITFL